MRRSVVASTIVGWMCLATLSACDLVGLQRCENGGCPSGSQCNTETNYCEAVGIQLVQPADGAAVGPSVQVVAVLAFRDLPVDAPEALDLTAGTQHVSLSRGEDGRYTGQWTPSTEGELSLMVSGGGMTSAEVAVTVDLTPPSFVLSAPPPTRSESAAFSDRDGDAWKRDEVVRVQVTAADTINLGSVQYSLQANAGGAIGEVTPPRPVGAEVDGGSDYVGAMEVDLSVPKGFNGFRGAVVVNVTGEDLAGNVGTGSVEIPVTRFKWRRRYPFDGRQLDPVIADDGALWTGVVDGGNGRILRIGPDGDVAEFNAPGLVGGLLIADHPGDLSDGVYFTANTDGGAHAPDAGTLQVIHAGTRTGSRVCGPYAGGIYPQMAVLYGNQTTGGLVQSVAFGAREAGGVLVGARIDGAEVTCVGQQMPFSPTAGTDWGASFSALYLTQGSTTSRWNLTSTGWVEEGGGWPSASTVFTSIAPNGTDLYGSGQKDSTGGLYVLASNGLTGLHGSATTGPGMARPAAFTPDWIGYFGDGKGSLVMASKSGVLDQIAVDAGVAPVIGADETVYAIDGTGRLAALTEDLQEQWSWADAGLQPGAMLLDCARYPDGGVEPARPGVLYIPSGASLTAVVTESRSLPGGGWPRARHDNRNSASATTFIPACP